MDGELLSLVTVDGLTLDLSQYGDAIKFLVAGGFGMPPVQQVTHRGYLQVGVTHIDTIATPRTVTALLYRTPVCSRADYWAARAQIEDFFRNNRGGPLTLNIRLPDGSYRALSVRPTPGPIFPPSDPAGNIWTIQESLEFTAFDPIWYNPIPTLLTPARAARSSLVFPITFPITFSFGGPEFDLGPLTYRGTMPAWILIDILGPYTWAKIVNNVTGGSLILQVAVDAGDRRTIDFRNELAIYDSAGVNCITDLSADSAPAELCYQPAPTAAQTLTVSLNSGTSESAVYAAIYERYWGI